LYFSFQEYLFGFVLVYQIFDFVTDKQNNLDIEKAQKRTALPIFTINGYALNKALAKVEKIMRRKLPKSWKFAPLDFKSKYNCDPDTSIYEPGSIFKKLDAYYANRAEKHRYENPNV